MLFLFHSYSILPSYLYCICILPIATWMLGLTGKRPSIVFICTLVLCNSLIEVNVTIEFVLIVQLLMITIDYFAVFVAVTALL